MAYLDETTGDLKLEDVPPQMTAPPTAHMEYGRDLKFGMDSWVEDRTRVPMQFPLLSRAIGEKQFSLIGGEMVVFPPLLGSKMEIQKSLW